MTPTWLEPDWPAPPGVRVISTFRGGGVSAGRYESLNLAAHVGDAQDAVADNRRSLRLAAGLPREPSWLEQVHGTRVADLDLADAGHANTRNTDARNADIGRPAGAVGPADAAITRAAGTVCAILTADCLPVVFATESGDAVAAAHAGWRGLAAGVLEATVGAFGGSQQRLLAWLGPGIGPKHFEVGAEVREAFLKAGPAAGEAFRPNAGGRFMADLALLARQRLERLGVTRVFGGGECTYARADRYFSHRRDGTTGRQATLIWREPA